MLKDIFKTKKQKEAEKQLAEQQRLDAMRKELTQKKAAQKKEAQERQARPDQVAAYKLLSAALDDTGLRWISQQNQTLQFHSPALSADIYLTYIYATNHATRTDYRVKFNDSVEVFVNGEDPVGKLAENLHTIGADARRAASCAEEARRKQVLFDLAARVKSR